MTKSGDQFNCEISNVDKLIEISIAFVGHKLLETIRDLWNDSSRINNLP